MQTRSVSRMPSEDLAVSAEQDVPLPIKEEPMLRTYTLTLPLIYDSYNSDPIQKDTQLLMGLDRDITFSEKAPAITEEISGKAPLALTPVWDITISCPCHIQYNILPEREFTMTISGVTAHSKQEAFRFLLPLLHRTCRALSMMMNQSNRNRHLFQPRIEPDYDRGKWSDVPCEAYREAVGQREGTRDYIDESGTHVIEMYASAEIAAEVFCETTIYGALRADDFQGYYDEVNAAADFLPSVLHNRVCGEGIRRSGRSFRRF